MYDDSPKPSIDGLGGPSYDPAKINELSADAATLIDQAKQHLHDALDLWQPLHDPEPERPDQNFQLDDKPYNYRAAETHRLIIDVEGGVLTRYPLSPVKAQPASDDAAKLQNEYSSSRRFNVALSFPGEHRSFVLKVAKALADKLTPDRVFYDEWYEVELLGAGGDLKLQSMYEDADLVVPFFSKHYGKKWCSMEW